MHLPTWADDEYLAQLTSEKRVPRYKRGKGTTREYIKTRSRNEALDLEVYNLAALYSLGQMKLRSLAELAEQANEPPDPAEEQAENKAMAAAAGQEQGSSGADMGPGAGSSWVNGWR
jgi:phage terminase large subunit GpA-like protein